MAAERRSGTSRPIEPEIDAVEHNRQACKKAML
jgi:hypothetical protein